jgi:hypothetical protein
VVGSNKDRPGFDQMLSEELAQLIHILVSEVTLKNYTARGGNLSNLEIKVIPICIVLCSPSTQMYDVWMMSVNLIHQVNQALIEHMNMH